MTWNDTITGLQFRLYYEPESSMNVTFLELKKNIDGVPRMVLSFDDGYTSVFTTAFPIMHQYGIKGTVYLNSAYVGDPGRLTLDQLHQLYDAGWTIANHTPEHTDLTTLTSVAAIKAVIQQGIDWLLANGFTRGAYDFALPFGSYNNMVLEALKECGIQTDRTVMLRMTGIPTDDLLQISQEGPNGDGYPNGENYTTLAQAEKFVDDTIQNKVSTFVMMHMIDDSPASGLEWATADFTNWIAYIAQTGIETETVDQWYNDVSGLTFSQVNYSPWIILNESTNTNSLLVNSSSIITADFSHNSNGDDISALGNIPDGLVVNFSTNSLGTVNPINTITLNGKATTTFTADENSGISTVNADANNQTVNININIVNSLPISVISTDPVNSAVKTPLNEVIKINFNQAIILGKNPWIELKTSTGVTEPFKLSTTGNTLIITPTTSLTKGTQYTVIVHSCAVTSLTGVVLGAPYSTKFTTDTTPTVKSVNPVNGAINVALNKIIEITFNKAIKLGSNPWIEFKTSTGVAKPFKLSVSGSTLIITPTTSLTKGTQYTVVVHSNAIISTTDAGFAAPYSTKFTTT